jgi:membrane-bound inhibitor of C-type lysozyme
MNRATPDLGQTIMTALLLVGDAAGALAQDAKPVRYACAARTRLQASFSPPGPTTGSLKLEYAGSSTEKTLPRALSADQGRYTQGDVGFWIKGNGATLT